MAEPRAFVGAFGKHPAWDDHLDDLGLDTDRLVSIKRVLYVDGISANVDSGAWENLDPSQRLDAFDHDFLWWIPLNGAPDVTIGRLAASTDGKGRSKYPMVLVAQCSGCSLPWAAHRVPALFAQTRERRRQATTQDQVRAEVDLLRAELNGAIASAPRLNASSSSDSRSVVLDAYGASVLVEALMQEKPEALARALYALRTQCAGFLPDAELHAPASPTSVRLPVPASIQEASVGSASPALSGWLTILLLTLDPATPVLLVKPAAGSWVDAFIGEPGSQQVFALRAGEARVSKVSDVPFTLDAEALRRAEALREQLRVAAPMKSVREQLRAAVLPDDQSVTTSTTGTGKMEYFLPQPVPHVPVAAAVMPGNLTITVDRLRKGPGGAGASRLRVLAPIGLSLCAWAAASSWTAPEALGATDAAVMTTSEPASDQAALDQAGSSQAGSSQPARVDSRARYNQLLEAFARALEPGPDGVAPADEAARAAALSFIAETMQLPGGIAYLREVDQTLDALQQALDAPIAPGERPEQPSLPAQPPRLGPGAIPGVVASLLPDGRARFVLPAGRGAGGGESGAGDDGPTIEFVRVIVPRADAAQTSTGPGSAPAAPAASPAPSHAVWVSTTEVSARLFNDVVDSFGSWRELAKAMPPFGMDQDERLGPRVWRWSFGKRAGSNEVVTLGLIPATGWLVRSEGPGSADVYAKGLDPGAPNLDMPMQHLPPEAAMYAAGLLRCRLPTSAEWRAALAANAPGPNQGELNLRDRTWGRQQLHNEERAAQGRRTWSADSGAFTPTDLPETKEPKSALVVGADDGVLWLAPVGVGGTGSAERAGAAGSPAASRRPPLVKHLVGNVAEWVWDPASAAQKDRAEASFAEPSPAEPSPAEARLAEPSPTDIDALQTALEGHPAGLGIVGGSALSDPRVPNDQPLRPLLSEAREGYADVGFRLVFLDDQGGGGAGGLSGVSLTERLRMVLTPLPVLKSAP